MKKPQLKVVLGLLASRVQNLASVKKDEVFEIARAHGYTYASASNTFLKDEYKSARGRWDLRQLYAEVIGNDAPAVQAAACAAPPVPAVVESPQPKVFNHAISSIMNDEVFIPTRNNSFVPWGEYQNIHRIIQSRMFFPVYIGGMSGNGKTIMVEQACAKLKREYVRVQISPETDEDDLIGGFRLINGETVFHKGPVVKAMEQGCILLIDELDRGSNKIMCLQGVLEGKPIMIKKTGQVISPAPGFNVFATANTKGRGSDDGRYSAANIIDDAFIERFVATIDQQYPSFWVEQNIVLRHMEEYGVDDTEFAEKLVNWSAVIRKSFEDDAVDEVISTRRLCHIVKAYSIFNDRLESIRMCISRFEIETREAFLDLYTKIDAAGAVQPEATNASAPSQETNEDPF